MDKILGLGLNQVQTRITQHKHKINLPFDKVRNGIINFYVDEVRKSKRELIKNQDLRTPTNQVAMWLSRRTESELTAGEIQHDLWLDRGEPGGVHIDERHPIEDDDKIWLVMQGWVGNGKTTMLRAIFELIKQLQDVNDHQYAHLAPFSCYYITAQEMVELFKEDKSAYIGRRNCQLLLIDDVGKEPAEFLDYGNVYKVFEDMMQYRYNNRLGTIITSNLSRDNFAEVYGARNFDRMLECTKWVAFAKGSFRDSNFMQKQMIFDSFSQK